MLGQSGLIDVGTGVLRSCSELEATLDHTVLPDYRLDYSIKHARLLRADATTATVDLDATIETVTTDGRAARTRTLAQGPVQLVREGDAWKVADLIVDGVSLRSSFFENGVTGSTNGLTVRVLGGRVFATHVLAFLELSNELEREVKVESVTLGQRRSLLPGWRWARGSLPVDTVPPGTLRVDTAASLQNAHAGAAIRLLLKTDAGLVDARPGAVRSRRRLPVSVRYPWAWSSAIAAAVVLALGGVFGWWIAGLALVQIAGVTLLSFEGHLRRGVGRPTLIRLVWTLTGLAAGVALFFTHGGFGRFRGDSDRVRVTKFAERATGAPVVRTRDVIRIEVGACSYGAWVVQTTKLRWWIILTSGPHNPLPLSLYQFRLYPSAVKAIGARRAIATELPGSC